MKAKFISIIPLIFLLTFVVADVISINSGGGMGFIISPSQELEGFFSRVNILPIVSNVVLNSTFGTNTTFENLTVYYSSSDADGDPLINITDWRVDGNSLTVLNMPFDSRKYNGTIRDYSTYGNNGTLGGGNSNRIPVWNITGKIGGAYWFDGVDDFINGDGPVNIDNGDFTMTAWIWEDADTPNSWAGPMLVGNSYFAGFLFTSNRFLTYNGTHATSVSIAAPTRTWNYVVAVHNLTGKNITTYLNGDLVDTELYTGTLVDSNDKFAIGSRYQTGSSIFFNGTIDEVKIYNRSLSPEQIQVEYQAGLAGKSVETFVSQETEVFETWQVAVTPNDKFNDGITVLSNNLTIVGCGNLSDSGTTYTLKHNSSINGSTCFTISAEEVTLDCDGRSIIGNDTFGTYGVHILADDVTVRNCYIEGFQYQISVPEFDNSTLTLNTLNTTYSEGKGIQFFGAESNDMKISHNKMYGLYGISEASTITNGWEILNNTIETNDSGGASVYLSGLNNSVMANNTITHYGESSNALQFLGYNTNLTGNMVTSLGYTSIYLMGTSNNLRVENNTGLSKSGFPGLYGGYWIDSVFYNNNFTGAPGLGAQIYGVLSGTFFINNTFQGDNFAGLTFFPSASEGVFENNTMIGVNDKDGIYTHDTAGSYDITFRNNTITTNTGRGIYSNAQSYNLSFYWNTFTDSSGYFVQDFNGTNHYNTTVNGVAQGNFYFNISSLEIFDSSGDGWGDTGADYPVSNLTWISKFSNYGIDYGPATEEEDVTVPIITVHFPLNETYNTSTIWFNATANEAISAWIVNYNGTNVTLPSVNTTLEVEDGNHHLLLYANDTSGNWGVNDTIYFTVDTIPPIVNIISPNETNYTTLDVDFNVTIIESENISTCLYSLNQTANVTMNRLNDTYFWYEPSLTTGTHNVTFYCNDTINNWGTNSTNFTILDEAAISISLSPNLAWNVNWTLLTLPADDLDATGNNGTGPTTYYVNLSVTSTTADLYVRADGDLLTGDLDVLGLGNETFVVNSTNSSVPDLSRLTMSTSYTLIGENLANESVVYMKFYLDAPTGQAAGEYLNNLNFKAVSNGQTP